MATRKRIRNLEPKIQKPTTIEIIGGIDCFICGSSYKGKQQYEEHFVEKHSSHSAGIQYSCVTCSKEFQSYALYRGHCYNVHIKKNRFECDICCRIFSRNSALKDHINKQHTFKCSPPCNKEFSSKKDLKLHQILHSEKNQSFPCLTCKKVITTVDECELHLHRISSCQCPICNQIIPDTSTAGTHLAEHFTETADIPEDYEEDSIGAPDTFSINKLGGILCCCCGATFSDCTDFDSHFWLEHSEKDIVYSCNVCSNQYGKYRTLANHCYEHIMKDRFSCGGCDKSFQRLSLLVLHQAECRLLGGGARAFACAHCPASFSECRRLKLHLKKAHDIFCIQCATPGCSETFEKPKDLIIHQNSHKTNNNNWCRQCGLALATLGACEKHLEAHKKNEYPCPICNKQYHEKHNVLKHALQHFEAAYFVCKTCGKFFNARYRLVEHMKTHTAPKEHACDYCGKRFFIASELQQHLNIHTGAKPYECLVCIKKFATYSTWHKHLTKVHKLDWKTIKKENLANNNETNKIAGVTRGIFKENAVIQINKSKHLESPKVQYLKQDIPGDTKEIFKENGVIQKYEHKHLESTNIQYLKQDTSEKPDLMITEASDLVTSASSTQIDYVDTSSADLREQYLLYEKDIDRALLEKAADVLLQEEMSAGEAAACEAPDTFPDAQHIGAYVPDATQESVFIEIPPSDYTESYQFPCEYGPDFIHRPGLDPTGHSSNIIDMDDYILPHIDPHLTINKNKIQNNLQNSLVHESYDQNFMNEAIKWEPTIVTKVCYQYEQMNEINANILLSVMNTDIY